MAAIYFTVTTDLTYDQRMIRICTSLAQAGYDVVLVGRKRPSSVALQEQPYRQKRISCLFDKGKLFYAEYNIRLFFYLLFKKMRGICAIDLDTILPCYYISRFKKVPRIYDAHELFCEMKEIITRPSIYKFWKKIERLTVPHFTSGYTVNQPIADEFRRMYGCKYEVIRSIAKYNGNQQTKEKYILYQGAVNEGRSFETLIPAMRQVNSRLIICGDGNFMEQAKQLAKENAVENKVIFKGMIAPAELKEYTSKAYIGITLFENKGLSNYFSLANRFFDYIQAGTPQLCVDYPVYRDINSQYKVAELVDDLSPLTIAAKLNRLLTDETEWSVMHNNCLQAAKVLNWENEEKNSSLFIKIYLDKHLHIVSFDVPFPADYGGVIDVFYKIVWLHKQGIKIHLHCFTKGRKPQPELEKYCASVHYYKRTTGIAGISVSLPYIVSSRKSNELLYNLKKDNHPILFEGVHTTYWLYKNKFPGRQVFIRLHNVETIYYDQLRLTEKNIFRKAYFLLESKALKKYEQYIISKATLLAISLSDKNMMEQLFAAKNIVLLPAFIEWETTNIEKGTGAFCLYHGNLSVNENDHAAKWLLKNVFINSEAELYIAGKSPSTSLLRLAKKRSSHIIVFENPPYTEMQDYIAYAQINILPSFNSTGVKLKLLNALFNGRHCIINSAAVKGSGLEELCVIAETPEEFKAAVQQLLKKPFTEEDIQKRKAVLNEKYSNEKNSKLLASLIQ